MLGCYISNKDEDNEVISEHIVSLLPTNGSIFKKNYFNEPCLLLMILRLVSEFYQVRAIQYNVMTSCDLEVRNEKILMNHFGSLTP